MTPGPTSGHVLAQHLRQQAHYLVTNFFGHFWTRSERLEQRELNPSRLRSLSHQHLLELQDDAEFAPAVRRRTSMPAKSSAPGAPDSRLWLLLLLLRDCGHWNRTSTPGLREQESCRRHRLCSSTRLRLFDGGCPAPGPGAGTTDASDSGLPGSQFYGCLIPQLYNTVRLHSAIGYITPADMLAGRQKEIHEARDRKLETAREQRKLRRQKSVRGKMTLPGETEAGSAGTQPC